MYNRVKRLIDFSISIIALPFFAILILAVGTAIKLEDGGPVFYKSKRVGYHGKIFVMYKFRSMKVNALDLRYSDGSTYNSEEDPRVTKVGRFLRKTSLDEIPQILNILAGDMALIGPRPDSAFYLKEYTDEERIILTVRPGITGYNQAINRNAVGTKEKLRNDIIYVRKMSFLFDIKIIFMTIKSVLLSKNVYRDQFSNESAAERIKTEHRVNNMVIWIIGIGEPLVIDGKDVRLRRIGNLAEYLSKQGCCIHYFSNSFDHYRKKQRIEKDTVFQIHPNYYLHVLKAPGYQKNVSFARIRSHRKSADVIRKEMERCKRPDIILCGNTPLEMVEQVSLYGEKNKIPLVIDMRDLWPDIFADAVPKSLKPFIRPYIWFCRNNLKKSIIKFDSVIGLSQAFVDYGLRLAGREMGEKDKVVPMGYPDYTYDISEETFHSLWNRFGLETTDKIVAFTGNFGRQFEFGPLIGAARRLEKENIKFVLCGTGENWEKVRKLCGENVIFPGWVEKDMIISLLQYSSIGIAPYIDSFNYRNNTPNKFGEYLSAGLPILVSVTGCMEQFLSEYQCGYSYRDVDDLVYKIRDICNKEDDEMGRRSRDLYEKFFSVEKVNKSIYEHLQYIENTDRR